MNNKKEQTDYEKSLQDCEDVWFKRYRLKCEEVHTIRKDLIKKSIGIIEVYEHDMQVLEGDKELNFEEHILNIKQKLKEL